MKKINVVTEALQEGLRGHLDPKSNLNPAILAESIMARLNVLSGLDYINGDNDFAQRALLLDESILADAFTVLHEDWGKSMLPSDKAHEMRAILRGSLKPCKSFTSWVNFIVFLSQKVNEHEKENYKNLQMGR